MPAPFRTIKPGDRALTVAEVAALTGFSRDTITRMFEPEPGVLGPRPAIHQPQAALPLHQNPARRV